MLVTLTIRNFKRFSDVVIDLGSSVVFVGPNNSGKTTALQALALWSVGLKKWTEKRGARPTPEKRPGVTINRQDLISLPVPDANLMWRNLHVRDVESVAGSPRTSNVRVDVLVAGVTEGVEWQCGLEFDYANPESFYCRPLRTTPDGSVRMPVPPEASGVRVAFLPPMSGLAATETRLDPGAVNVRLGEGRTAEVLRNLCYQLVELDDDGRQWNKLTTLTKDLFGVDLNRPRYIPERGEVEMSYRDGRIELDLSSSGRGLQQTVLLLAHMLINPGSVLLLDEPDAHLEFLRQRQTYALLSELASETGSQVVAASHSEVVLNEAADRDMVIAFVGSPHRIDDRGYQVQKALKEIGFDQYAQAELTGWVLYLEGATDLAILRAFAERLEHPAAELLKRPFVKYVGNQPGQAAHHFSALLEAREDLVGFALYDRMGVTPNAPTGLTSHVWSRHEVENYLAQDQTLLAWAEAQGEEQTGGPLFAVPWRTAMEESISEVKGALETLGSATDLENLRAADYLGNVLRSFYGRLGLPDLTNKNDFHTLAPFVPEDLIADEIAEVLSELSAVAERAKAAELPDESGRART